MSAIYANQVSSRVTNLVELPGNVLTSLISTVSNAITGIALSALSMVTLGLDKNINFKATDKLQDSNLSLIPQLFKSTVSVINPSAKFDESSAKGICSFVVQKGIFDKAEEFADSDNFFVKHVISRLVYASAAVTSVAARILDFAFGVIAATFAIIFLGTSRDLNQFVFHSLNVFGVIGDVMKGIRGLINPQQQYLNSIHY